MFRFASRFLVIIAAVQILGGHWAVLQTVAWTSMLIDNAKTVSFAEAFTRTFDGTQPCSLCKAVTAGRNSEEKQEVSTQLVKFEAVLAPAMQLPPREEAVHHFSAFTPFERVLAVAPPTPPPRLS